MKNSYIFDVEKVDKLEDEFIGWKSTYVARVFHITGRHASNRKLIKVYDDCISFDDGDAKAVAFIKEHKRELKLMSLGI